MAPFVHAEPVRFGDIDHAGIVYYPRFFHYFHLAFEELWRARVGPRAYALLLDRDRVGFPVVRASCEFVAPLRFGDTAEIQVSVIKLGGKSITFRYRVHRVTAFRWIEKAKELLVKATLDTLRTRLKLPADELDSVLRMIRSQIHLSLVRHLGGPKDSVADDAIELDPSEIEEV